MLQLYCANLISIFVCLQISKWKTLSKDAFDSTGDELNELLKRGMLTIIFSVPPYACLCNRNLIDIKKFSAVRKAKFFLHPDKLPKDVTENQALVFRTIWDAIQEQEALIN